MNPSDFGYGLAKESFVYRLWFASKPKVCYIGTTVDMQNRLSNHHYRALTKKKDSKLYNWLRKYIPVEPLCHEILCVVAGSGYDAEIIEIAKAKADGFILKNSTLGGEGVIAGFKHTQKTKEECRRRALAKGTWQGKDNPALGRRGIENQASKPVYQYGTDGKFITGFHSMRLAAESVVGDASKSGAIGRGIKNGCRAHGFFWSFDCKSSIAITKTMKTPTSQHNLLAAVKMVQSGMSVSMASKLTSVNRARLTLALKL